MFKDSPKTSAAMLAAIIFAASIILTPKTKFVADGIDPNWDAAVNNRNVNEPTVVFFTAGWCPGCQALAAGALQDAGVQNELYHHYNVYTVDLTDPSPEVRAHSSKMGISRIPTMIRYGVDGQETSRRGGGSTASILEWLRAGE